MIPTLYELSYIVSYKEGDVSLQRTPVPFVSGVEDDYYVVKDGDTIESIAQDKYDNQQLWYIIADANPVNITSIFELTPNTTILIPSLETLELVYGQY